MARKRQEESPDSSRNSKKGYVKAERGRIKKWSKGEEVEGTYLRLEDGSKYDSKLLKIRVNGKVETWSCPTVLRSYMEDIQQDTEVVIKCLGQTIESNYGQKAFDFEVYYVPI